jgi:inner membrane protein COX18
MLLDSSSILIPLHPTMATALLRPKRALAPSSHISIKTNLSPIFLQLPAPYRSFHASSRPHFLDTGVATAHALIEALHTSTGLPWVYTLPLAALTVRATLILPLSIYSRRVTQKQACLAPLVQSWQHVLRKEAMDEAGHLGPQAVQQKLLWRMRQKRSEIYGRWGCQIWKTMLPLVQLPVWLTAIEAVRAMCGTRAGLLGMIMRSDNDADAISAGIPKELSLATEGALWFPDLLVPDPQLILPFLLSGAVFLNLTNARGRAANQAVWQRRLQRSLKLVALALGPLTLQVPSAMLVYWISSSLLAYVQAVILDRAMPMPPAIKPCDPRKRRMAAKGTAIADGSNT